MTLRLSHLGESGFALAWDDAVLHVDPPLPGPEPAIVTWSETERVAGARGGMLADPAVLRWCGVEGVALGEGAIDYAGFAIVATPFTPIPWATPIEAVRKTRIGLVPRRRDYDWLTFG